MTVLLKSRFRDGFFQGGNPEAYREDYSKIMSRWQANTKVAVYPFTRQPEEEEIVIGRLDTGVFLVLPKDAVDLLDFLSAGKTVEEAQSLYSQKYGEVPDMEDFLDLLEQKGFVYLGTRVSEEALLAEKSLTPSPIRYHFSQFPQSLAQSIFSRPVLLNCALIIALALGAMIMKPSLIPGWRAFFFEKDFLLMSVLLTILGSIKVFFHEMAHLIAARAVGVSSRIAISNRMWILVAETDMTGIWSVPRNQRYLPLLAGPLLDLVSAAVLTLILLAYEQGWLSIPPVILQLGKAMLLTYLLGLLWQCYFFVRTDFYYVVANFFRCKNLMKDTENFITNQLARILPFLPQVDQSHINRGEMRIIRLYALIWIVGRTAALACLIFITIPLIWHYYWQIGAILTMGFQNNPYSFINALLMGLMLLPLMAGFYLWIFNSRNLRR